MSYYLNIRGELLDLSCPRVMGVINVTPDSFYQCSRAENEAEIIARAELILSQGGDFIDIGACSTRPQSVPASEDEERERLRWALPVIRRHFPDARLSLDTFRANIARECIEEYGVDIINDCSEGSDERMFDVMAKTGTPYILTSNRRNLHDTLMAFADKVQRLRELGQKDIILDAGFGFGKSMDENFAILRDLDKLLCMELPLLVGVSRKSMIWKTLATSPDEALAGTTAANTIALMNGASILRVHDVREACETIKIVKKCFSA